MLIFNCLLYVLAIYSIHELGHVIAVLAIGGKITGLVLDWHGVGLRWQGNSDPYRQMIVTLSGPAANLLIFAVCLVVGGLGLFGLCNLVFGVVNLALPGGDGARAAGLIRAAKNVTAGGGAND